MVSSNKLNISFTDTPAIQWFEPEALRGLGELAESWEAVVSPMCLMGYTAFLCTAFLFCLFFLQCYRMGSTNHGLDPPMLGTQGYLISKYCKGALCMLVVLNEQC